MRELEFDWDQWNVQKNELKHGVSSREAESCFFEPNSSIFQDYSHSTPREKRFILYGKGQENRVLMVGFTVRKGKIRIITARPASRKERQVYEEENTRD